MVVAESGLRLESSRSKVSGFGSDADGKCEEPGSSNMSVVPVRGRCPFSFIPSHHSALFQVPRFVPSAILSISFWIFLCSPRPKNVLGQKEAGPSHVGSAQRFLPQGLKL